MLVDGLEEPTEAAFPVSVGSADDGHVGEYPLDDGGEQVGFGADVPVDRCALTRHGLPAPAS